jgi:hypothetical protein
MSAITAVSTGTNPSEWRVWWQVEAGTTGTDWKSLIELHCAILDRLRASSSRAWSS